MTIRETGRTREFRGVFNNLIVALITAAVVSCNDPDSVVLVSVSANADVPPIMQIRTTMSNQGTTDVRIYPQVAHPQPIVFPATFAIVVPHSRSGALDLVLEALNVAGLAVANGAARVEINVGGRVEAAVVLATGVSPCGNRIIDPGEECDDGNRLSGDGCDFLCRKEVVPSLDGGLDAGDGGPSDATVVADGPHPAIDSPSDAPVVPICQSQSLSLQAPLPPEVMLVFDRSGSMARNADFMVANPTRWEYAASAVDQVLLATESRVLWGLKVFPNCTWTGVAPFECTPTPCTVDGNALAPAVGQRNSISTTLLQLGPPHPDTGASPTTLVVNFALASLQARQTPHQKFILLVTDGNPSCKNFPGGLISGGESDVDGAVAAIRASNVAGVPVFIVGVTSNTGPLPYDGLNAMADAGGRARSADPKFYPALDGTQAASALAEIAASTISCSFGLSAPVPDGVNVEVRVGGPVIAKDDWSFSPGRDAIQLLGASCGKYQRGELTSIDAATTCPVTAASAAVSSSNRLTGSVR